MGSPLSLILLIWIIFVIYLLGFKSIKNALSHDGVIRKKYFLLGLGTIIIATSQAIAGFTTSFILLTVFRTTILFASLVFYYSLRSEPEKKKKEIKIEHGIFRIIKSSEPHLSLQEKESYDNLQDGISVFFSYATVDASYFKIPQFAKKLISYDEILEVRYWQKDMRDDILKFMNDNLKECDILLLFCSENALQSDPVEMEWQSALKIGKKIIPIFVQEKNIPPLLSTKLGVQFNKNNLNETINSVHDLILKKLR
jgi:hypothetical protein